MNKLTKKLRKRIRHQQEGLRFALEAIEREPSSLKVAHARITQRMGDLHTLAHRLDELEKTEHADHAST